MVHVVIFVRLRFENQPEPGRLAFFLASPTDRELRLQDEEPHGPRPERFQEPVVHAVDQHAPRGPVPQRPPRGGPAQLLREGDASRERCGGVAERYAGADGPLVPRVRFGDVHEQKGRAPAVRLPQPLEVGEQPQERGSAPGAREDDDGKEKTRKRRLSPAGTAGRSG